MTDVDRYGLTSRDLSSQVTRQHTYTQTDHHVDLITNRLYSILIITSKSAVNHQTTKTPACAGHRNHYTKRLVLQVSAHANVPRRRKRISASKCSLYCQPCRAMTTHIKCRKWRRSACMCPYLYIVREPQEGRKFCSHNVQPARDEWN